MVAAVTFSLGRLDIWRFGLTMIRIFGRACIVNIGTEQYCYFNLFEATVGLLSSPLVW